MCCNMFCNTFKYLLIKYFVTNIVIIAFAVSQDMSVFTRDSVKEVCPGRIGLPCAIHVGKKIMTVQWEKDTC